MKLLSFGLFIHQNVLEFMTTINPESHILIENIAPASVSIKNYKISIALKRIFIQVNKNKSFQCSSKKISFCI